MEPLLSNRSMQSGKRRQWNETGHSTLAYTSGIFHNKKVSEVVEAATNILLESPRQTDRECRYLRSRAGGCSPQSRAAG